MTILPHHVAASLLLGGLTLGGYFAVSAFTPASLDSHLRGLGVEVLNSGWEDKEAEYKAGDGEELISSIPKVTGNEKIPDFANKLEKWCTKYKGKYFLGENDANYKRFSRWCTKTANIQTVLERRGFKNLNSTEQSQKFDTYKADTNTDKFLPQPTTPKKELVVDDLNSWCTKQKAVNYKYETDSDLKRIIQWCYKK